MKTRLILFVSLLFSVGALLPGCQLVPQRPDAVFTLYRERMKAGNIEQARDLLGEDSKSLAVKLASGYKLPQPPENLALLNILDPVGSPVVVKETEATALLQIRTLKGGLRLIRLVRAAPKASWKIDMAEELDGLRIFLEARGALDMIREQAGEYATFWKAFTNQLSRMSVVEPSPELPAEKPQDKTKKKESKKKPAKK